MSIALLTTRCEDNPFEPDVRADNEVWITASGFEPATLTVTAGTTVVWLNKDDANHTVDSGEPNKPTSLFSSKVIRPNDSWEFAFTAKGTFSYYCSRTLAKGKIIVN